MQFKVLRGIHSDGGRLYAPLAHDGSPTPGTVGDIVETDTDLVRKHGAAKFKQIHDPEPVDEPVDPASEYGEVVEQPTKVVEQPTKVEQPAGQKRPSRRRDRGHTHE